jgi:anti-sigma regulatory factor (Ser/Thr protein kinase)
LVRRALTELDSPGGDLTLIASELVTNAVLYSGCTEDDEIEVHLDRTNAHLRLSVIDPGRSGSSAGVVNEERASGGLGLFVVDRFASRWGAERSDRYRVWAEMSTTPDGACT